MDWDTVYRIGTFAALGLSFYNFYLQRRDKRPRLKITLEFKNESVPTGKLSDYGTTIVEDADVVVIHAANPTERTIRIQSIRCEAKGQHPFLVSPLNRSISEVPAHEKRYVLVAIGQLQNNLLKMNLTSTKLRFLITDALGYRHKSKWFKISAK